jgi:hypothetical protein
MDPTIRGEVVYLYAFDVANDVATAAIKTILGKRPQPFEIRVDRTSPKDVPVYKPLAVEPAPLSAHLAGQEVRPLIRVYEVGVVSVTLRVSFAVGNLLELLPLHNPTLDDGRSLDQAARDLVGQVCREIQPFLIRPSVPSDPEAYTAFSITYLRDVTDVDRWLQDERRAVAGLLTETDPAQLSEAQIAEVLRVVRSFEISDSVIIDWDAALVLDLTGYVEDTLYILELANLQLEEFRVIDRALDRYLDRAYEDLEKRHLTLFGMPTLVLRTLRRFRVDVTKLADEVTHITKFFGDWHLARVYLAARDRFYLEQWRGSVERRLAQLDQLYSVVHSEIYERRTLWLEVIVVLLILAELLAFLLWK